MADATTAASANGPRKRRLWPRVLAWGLGFLVILLVAVYLLLTSSRFFKNQILPRVSNSLHLNVTVSSAEISPFSQIVLHDLKVQPTNQPTLVTVPEVRLRYSLLALLAGDIRVDEIDLETPAVQIIQNADGTSNLDPLLETRRKLLEQKPAQSGKSSKPPKIEVRKLTLSNASIRKIQNHQGGSRDLIELTNVDLSINGLKNGGAGKVEFSALVRNENNPPAPAMYGLLQARIDGSFNFSLTPDLNPDTVLGDAHLNISQAAGSFSDFSKLAGALHCDLSAAEIKMISLRFQKGSAPLGELRASGPYDARNSEGRLNLELLAVDKQVLNLFAARNGIDFGSTTVTSTNRIELTKSKATITVAGQLNAGNFQVSRTNESTPPLDLRADYNVSIDKTQKTALLQTLNVDGMQNRRPLLHAELTSPMTLAWGNTTNAVGDSSFNLAITRLNIADWRTFVGQFASAGTVDMNLKVLSQHGGKQLTFDATNQIQNLTAQIGNQPVTDTTVLLKARGSATDFQLFNLSDYTLLVTQSNQIALTASGSGIYDRTSTNADFQVYLQATLPRVLRLLNPTNLTASAGSAELKAHVTQRQKTQTITGNLTVSKVTGTVSKTDLRNLGATVDLDLENTPDQIEIRKAAGRLTIGRNSGGDFELSGTYSTTRPSLFALKLSGFNQDGLRPLLENSLGNKKLVSVSLDGTASVQRNPNGDSSVKADLSVSNLVMSSHTQQLPQAPLETKVRLDASFAKQVADIHHLQITLEPTSRAKNEFEIEGRVDTSKTNAIQGYLKLTSDALDLTSYYDLFSATNKTPAKTNGRDKTPNAAAPSSPVETAATTNQLPFKDFTLDLNLRELYLREMAASNLQATLKLDRSRILLKPFQLTMNDSTLSGTINIHKGMPADNYALTFNGTNIPVAPLWNTFNPQDKGKFSGTLTAYGAISGISTSGESLQTNLTGTFNIDATNLNLAVGRIRSRALGLLVAVVARLPEIEESPLEAGASFVDGTFKGLLNGKLTGGLSSDISQSPIQAITLRGSAGDGHVLLQQAVVRSAAFEAEATNSTITLAPIPTNSTIDIPISIQLNKSLTSHLPALFPNESSTNTAYVNVPDFFSETGTIGDPRAKINKFALGKSIVQQAIPGLIIGTNSVIANTFQSIGELLPHAPDTNQPATNPAPAPALPNRLPGPKGK